jgi:hypothetical protein
MHAVVSGYLLPFGSPRTDHGFSWEREQSVGPFDEVKAMESEDYGLLAEPKAPNPISMELF